MNAIELYRLTKTFYKRLVLHELSLEIPTSERLVLFGPSGCGKRNVGMVFQDLALWPHMSVRGNLMFGLESSGIARGEAQSRVVEILNRVGLGSRITARPHELSGGEQQRVALARALVLRPSILLMDEPLSSLDDERKEMIVKDLLNLHQRLGFTLVYVTHSRSEAERIASRIVGMSGGV